MNANFLPATNGLSLGNSFQQWNGSFQNLTVTGTVSIAGQGVANILSSATPAFDGSLGNVFVYTLTANAVATTINLVAGYTYKFLIAQNATGNFTLTWPNDVFGGMVVDPTPLINNVQQFICPDGVNLYALSAGVSM